MSISGLSNHLYVVVTTVVGLLVAPSPFQQARAGPVSYDFTESRQFKKNLAVSKFRDNPHWMPNYTWKAPEKFHGPRKGPEWEQPVIESEADRRKKEEFEEWEKKMREVTNIQRQKWTNPGKTSSAAKKMQDDPDAKQNVTSEKDQNSMTPPDDWSKNLHNGRWGMSVKKPAEESEPPRSAEKGPASEPGGKITIPALISNGRFGMSAKEPPKGFVEELSRGSQTSEISGRVWKQDEDPKSTGNGKIHDGPELRMKGATATRLPEVFPSGRRGMSLDPPPREFLREISRLPPAGIPGFDKSTVVHQRAPGIAKNNPRPRGLMLSRVPLISGTLILQPFPRIIGIPMFPGYSMVQPRIWLRVPNCNVALFITSRGKSFHAAPGFRNVRPGQTS